MKIYDYILCSGSGNRFLLFDTLRSDLSGLNIAAFAAEELHRFGVDGLLLLTRDGRGRFGMRMFNTDGSEAEMCGNGIRCVARLARERYPEATGERFAVTSGGREYRITCEEPIFGALPTFGAEIPLSLHGDDFPPSLPAEEFVGQPVPELDEGPAFTFLQPGNPHIVALVAPDSAWLFGSDGRLDTRRLAELGERANRMRGVFPRESTSASSAGWTRDASSRRPTSAALASPPPAARRLPRAPRPPHCSDSPASTRPSRSGTAAAACAACRAARSRESSPA